MYSIECRTTAVCCIAVVATLAGCERLARSRAERSASSSSAAAASVSSRSSTADTEEARHPAPDSVSDPFGGGSQPEAPSMRAVPLPLMVMPLGANSAAAALRGKPLLPPDELDQASPAAPLGPEPQPLGRNLEQAPARPAMAKAYPQNIADKPVPRLGSQPWMISDEWEARHKEQLNDPNRAHAKVVFLGDSITDGWRMSASYKARFSAFAPLNLGISGEYTQNLLWRIEHGALDGLSPKAVVIMIGVNNLGGGFTAPQTASGVRAVVAATQGKLPGVPIVLLSILPAGEAPDAKLRQKIVETDELIAQMQAPGITVVDIGSVLLEPDGTISKSVLRDFLHPTEVGYARLGDALAPRLQQIVQQG